MSIQLVLCLLTLLSEAVLGWSNLLHCDPLRLIRLHSTCPEGFMSTCRFQKRKHLGVINPLVFSLRSARSRARNLGLPVLGFEPKTWGPSGWIIPSKSNGTGTGYRQEKSLRRKRLCFNLQNCPYVFFAVKDSQQHEKGKENITKTERNCQTYPFSLCFLNVSFLKSTKGEKSKQQKRSFCKAKSQTRNTPGASPASVLLVLS